MHRTQENGFTLLEMIVVVTIVGVLVAISFPMVHKWMESDTYRERARELVSTIRLARDKAVSNSSIQTLSIPVGLQDNLLLKSTDDCNQEYPLILSLFPDGQVTWSKAGGDPGGIICILDTTSQCRYKVKIESTATGRVTITSP